MKICFFTTSYPRYVGDGAGIFVSELAQHLVARGHQLTVVAPAGAVTGPAEPAGPTTHRFHYWWPVQDSQVAYGAGIVENLRLPVAKIQLPVFILAANIALWRYARSADLVHIHWWPNMAVLLGVLLILGKPVVLTAHGPDVHRFTRNPIFRIAAKFVFNRADQIIVVANSIRNRLIEIGVDAAKISVVPNGISEDEELLAIPRRQDFQGHCLNIGRLVVVKNHDLLLTAFAAVAKDWPGSTLTIIGDGPLKLQLQALAVQLDINNQVFFPGQQNRKQIHQALAAADIFVLSSTLEGLPIVILEAMAAGKPIIATAVNGVPDVIQTEQNGLLINSGDTLGFINGLRRLFDDSELRSKLGWAARRSAAQLYRWSLVAATTEKIYVRARTAK